MALIQTDRTGVITTNLYWDEQDGALHVERTQDVEPLLERAKRLRAMNWDGFNADRSMQMTHELPIAIVEKWFAEGVDIMNPSHADECRKRLADPALDGFRIAERRANAGLIVVKG